MLTYSQRIGRNVSKSIRQSIFMYMTVTRIWRQWNYLRLWGLRVWAEVSNLKRVGTHGADEVQRRYDMQLNPSFQFARKIGISPIPFCVVMAAKLQRNKADGAAAFGSLHEAFEPSNAFA